MSQQTTVSLMTRRAEETAITAHLLDEMGIKPVSISMNDQYAIIFINHSSLVKKLRGTACGSTYIKGNIYAVYQAMINNVFVKWFEPYFEHAVAKKVH